MVDQKIEFRKTRDFGENLNDTLSFIWLNLRPLLQSIFAICAIFMLIHAILDGLYRQGLSSFWELIRSNNIADPRFSSRYFDVPYFLIKLSKWLAIISVHVAAGAYIKFYVENQGEKPGIDQVWKIFRKYFFKVLLYSIPIAVLISFGMVFCLVPGVYLLVVLIPFSFVIMMENPGFARTFLRCFELIRNDFWTSFVIYVVVFLIYFICTLITSLLISGVMTFINYFTTYNLAGTIRILTSFFNLFSFCFYVVVLVSVAMNYFSLVEEKEGIGILDRINNIGGFNTKQGNTGEEY